MVRNLTDPDGDGTLEWQERVVDIDGDSVSIDLILDQVDDGTGFSNAADSNPSWLSYSTTTNTINTDETEVLVNIDADTSGLSEGYKYKFEITADDGITTTTRTFQLEVTGSPQLTDGTYLYISQGLDEYTFGTAWDITTLTFQRELSSAVSPNNPGWSNFNQGIVFTTDGKNAYGLTRNGGGDDSIQWFTMDPGWDFSTSKEELETKAFSTSNYRVDLSVKPDGTKILLLQDYSGYKVEEYTMSTPYDPSTMSRVNTFGLGGEFNDRPDGMWLNPSKGLLFVCAFRNKRIVKYSIDSSLDTTTMVAKQNVTKNFEFDDIFFNWDGTKLISVNDSGSIASWPLSTPWDLSTLGSRNDLSLSDSAQPDGMYIGR